MRFAVARDYCYICTGLVHPAVPEETCTRMSTPSSLGLLLFAGAIAARQNFTDADIVQFLTNVECAPVLFFI